MALIIIGILFVVFIAQNSQLTELRFLFWSVYISRVFVLLGTFFLGMLLGIVVVKSRRKVPKQVSRKKQ
jgi:uncharacterized integral membrane protein